MQFPQSPLNEELHSRLGGRDHASTALAPEGAHDGIHHLARFLLLQPERSVMTSLQLLHDPRLAGESHHGFLARFRNRLVFGANDVSQPAVKGGIAPRGRRGGRFEGEGGVWQQVGGVGLGDRCLDVGGEDLDGVERHGETGAGLC